MFSWNTGAFALLVFQCFVASFTTLLNNQRKTNRNKHFFHEYNPKFTLSLSTMVLSLSQPEDEIRKKQQATLIRRGQIEEQLMSKNQSPILFQEPTKTDETNDVAEVSKGSYYGKILQTEGVVRIDNVLSSKVADCMRDYVTDLKRQSTRDIRHHQVKPEDRFAKVLLNSNRCDLMIPLGPKPVHDALREVLCCNESSLVRQTIENLIGLDSTLYELSCLISDPGSQRQNVHPDHPCQDDEGGNGEKNNPSLLTCFIALQDITCNMGPTVWIPKTHFRTAHKQFQRIRVEDILDSESPKDKLLKNSPSVVGILPKGSSVIFDSRLLHCGTANTSETSRALFYFSFKNAEIGFPGNVGSIGYGLDSANVRLGELCDEIHKREKKNECL
mmetsp:Transcript_30781/g.46687  ORF Transcript_30781/g.46687 Transcript_30781/m.46687 type:complete len:387 (+) Transcript_30781:126-1286(+)